MTDDQIRSTMRALADRARPATVGLADSVLWRARRRRHAARASVAGSTVLAVTTVASLAFAAPWNAPSDGRTLAPAGTASPDIPHKMLTSRCVLEEGTPTELPEECSDQVPPEDNPKPPRDLGPLPDDARQIAGLRANDYWYVSDPETGDLTPTEWSWISASPDGDQLAVLEKGADQIGIVDRGSGEVEHWIDTPKGVGEVHWSPAGDQLVATVYGKAPTPDDLAPRKGFVLADPTDDESGELVPLDFQGGHVDYSWSGGVFWNGDGTGLVSSYTYDHEMKLGIRLLSLDGAIEKTLPNTGSLEPADGIATSPDNQYAMTTPDKTKSRVIDLDTGKVIERTRNFGAEAWLDEDQFIGNLAWTSITGELAVLQTDGTIVNKLWKAPKGVYVDGLAISRD